MNEEIMKEWWAALDPGFGTLSLLSLSALLIGLSDNSNPTCKLLQDALPAPPCSHRGA